jgi:hypothetical protein
MGLTQCLQIINVYHSNSRARFFLNLTYKE